MGLKTLNSPWSRSQNHDRSAAPFSQLEALPQNHQPVTTWANQDEAFREIAEGIRAVARGGGGGGGGGEGYRREAASRRVGGSRALQVKDN